MPNNTMTPLDIAFAGSTGKIPVIVAGVSQYCGPNRSMRHPRRVDYR